MVLLYMVTWIPSIYPLYVSIYTSTMDPMGFIYIYYTYYTYYIILYLSSIVYSILYYLYNYTISLHSSNSTDFIQRRLWVDSSWLHHRHGAGIELTVSEQGYLVDFVEDIHGNMEIFHWTWDWNLWWAGTLGILFFMKKYRICRNYQGNYQWSSQSKITGRFPTSFIQTIQIQTSWSSPYFPPYWWTSSKDVAVAVARTFRGKTCLWAMCGNPVAKGWPVCFDDLPKLVVVNSYNIIIYA